MDLISESDRLAASLVKSLLEQKKEIEQVVVAYPGEFQPFHKNHYKIFKKLEDKFGKDNIFIVISDDEDDKPLLMFEDKKKIIVDAFDIEEDHVKEAENPFIPKELLEQFDPDTTAFIDVVDSNTANLLSRNKYFEIYTDKTPLKSYVEKGYLFERPDLKIKVGTKMLSDFELAQVLSSSETSEKLQDKILSTIFPEKNKKVFDLIKKKMSDGGEKTSPDTTQTGDQPSGQAAIKKTTVGDTASKTSPEVVGSKNVPIIQRKIRNPLTGRAIKIQSALKYPRWKPVYKLANQVLKTAGIDRENRVDDPEVNQRYRERAKKVKKEHIEMELSQHLTEELLNIAREQGIELNIHELGTVRLTVDSNKKKINEHKILQEAGASGHLSHPYEDLDLTFNDMGEIVRRGLSGGLDKEASVSEKLDGQNLQFSFRDGKIIFARNKGQLKNFGQDAMDIQGVRDRYAGRDDLERSFGNAADDLNNAISALPSEERSQIFQNGKKWINMEIINPETRNVIPYNKNILIFHNTIEYDETGTELKKSQDEGDIIARSIQKVGASKQKTYGIQGPQNIAFSDKENTKYKEYTEKYLNDLNSVMQSQNLSENSTLGDYMKTKWADKLNSELQQAGATLPDDVKNGLLERWALGKKSSMDARKFKKLHPEAAGWFSKIDSEAATLNKKFRRPIENLFLNVGARSLVRMTNFVAANNPASAEQIKSELLESIKKLQENPSQDLLRTEMERLNEIGFDQIIPTEGVVFVYNGKPYKFTGAFAPVNQIMGALKFGRGQEGDTTTAPSSTGQLQKKPIVTYPGRFQPFHKGHYSVYKGLVNKYGKDNVYIVTSNKTDAEKSPFDFNEKQEIMSRMYDIPKDKIVQAKNLYSPKELTQNFPEDTPIITSVSSKDAERLSTFGNYFHPIPHDLSQVTSGYRNNGYFEIAPESQEKIGDDVISGTTIRNILGDVNKSPEEKRKAFEQIYGKFVPDVFKFMTDKLTTISQSQKFGSSPEKTKPETSTQTTPQKMSLRQFKQTKRQDLTDVLNKTVHNPETDNDILVKSALGYEPEHPARKNAERLINQSR